MVHWVPLVESLLRRLLALFSRPKYDLDKIPGPWREALPLLGNVLPLLRPDFHRVVLQWADQYGGIVRGKFLWHDGLLVTDPAALATICGRGEGALDKAAALYSPINFMCTPHGHSNLLTSPADEKWRAVRKAIALSFSFGNIKKKFPIIRERTYELVAWLRRVGPKESVDVDQAALKVTLDVIGLTAFGHDYGCVRLAEVPPSHLLRVLPRAFTEVMRRIANPLRALLPRAFKNGPKGHQSFVDFQEHMKQLLREMKARPPGRGDTDIGAQLYRVLEASRLEAEKASKAQGGRKVVPAITEERILSEIGILFVEGFETTGHTISWTLFNIATTPGVQEAAAAELASLGLLVRPRAEGGRVVARELELDDIKRMPYITACVKEAMRMFPVVSVMGRITERPTRVGPYLVPAGTPIATPLFAIQNTIHNWVKPEEFRPERWRDVPLESYVVDMRAKEGVVGDADARSSPANDAKGKSPVPAAANRPTAAPAGPVEAVASPPPAPASRPAVSASAAPPPSAECVVVSTPPPPPVERKTTSASPSPPLVERKTTRSISITERKVSRVVPLPTDPPARSFSHKESRRRREEPEDDVDEDISSGFAKRTGISFMPFSEGPRSCVGQSLAKLEVMTVLAVLLSNFRIELAEEVRAGGRAVCWYGSGGEMGGREGVRQRESTHLTLQTRGIRGIRMHLYPRDEE
ncbi:hypothetical protein GPECTOR_1g638 [Gonium pectorale]|uniref:Cytochrome P450 n=1 Tax=Gonium pectorale TaxID=33097 RepID=A0A150H4F0_GONPE|nr:hypothetical protein GPECTOR_1g638 [Gonium pectorale]|eukprot:KXZ56708.1 hypothetical protein GPECTOR_1g638 [Gonium pectorale]